MGEIVAVTYEKVEVSNLVILSHQGGGQTQLGVRLNLTHTTQVKGILAIQN